jgi:protein tyrosine phosphatase (PTP) superfamily phosphohydrolase (DUF442 family)
MPHTSLRTWLFRLLGIALLLVLAPMVLLVGWYESVHWDGNFHEVQAQTLYRSAQLGPAELEEKINTYHLKSILNLRGTNPHETWFEDEMRVSNAHQILHMDEALSAGNTVDTQKIERLLQMIDQAPKPLLIHCSDGADRTGLILALYLQERLGVAPDIAHEQLSWHFGHFPYLRWSYTQAMDESYVQYLNHLHGQD